MDDTYIQKHGLNSEDYLTFFAANVASVKSFLFLRGASSIFGIVFLFFIFFRD